MYQFVTPLVKAQTLFSEAASGQFRGRDSFCKLLEASSTLILAGDDPYRALRTTKQEFDDLLHAQYRRAARDNYQDSTNERFIGAGRPVLEALSDLHLVPVYMKLGELDPKRETSWMECGINHRDYLVTYNARRIDEAARIWHMIKDRPHQAVSNIIAHEDIQVLLKEAGLDTDDEQTYALLKTTKADFDRYQAEQKNLHDHPYARPTFA